MMQHDPVTNPEHYTWMPYIEFRDVGQYFDYFRGAALKYIWRSGRKEGESEERALEKAIESLKDRLRFLRGASAAELRHLDEIAP